MTKCCSFPAYEDPLYFDKTNLRIGVYARCAKCHKLIGEAKISTTIPKGMKESWTALSEVMTREHFAKDRDGRPMRFSMSAGGLAPVGYSGEVKAQPEMDEEAPF